MTLDVAHPAVWWAVPVVAVPLLIHLLSRARPPVFLFSSVEFLRRVTQRIRRVRRPKDLLLLALRTLLAAAALGVFLQPRLYGLKPRDAAGEVRSLVVIVDASASMAWREGAQSRFAAACAEADEVLRGLRPGDRANIVWLRSPARAELPAPGANLAFLRDRLRAAAVTREAGDPAEGLRLAAAQLRGAPGRHEICLVSDFQQAAWTALPALPEEIAVSLLPVARDPAANLALTRFDARPVRPLVGEDVYWSAEVCNFSPQPVRAEVRFEADEARDRQETLLPAWGRASVTFRAPPAAAGPRTAIASLGEDAFPDDNRAWATAQAWPALRVGLRVAEAADGCAWNRALAAIPWVQVVELGTDAWPVAELDALVLAGVGGEAVSAMRSALESGRAVIWSPARGLPHAALYTLAGAPAAAGAFTWEMPREPASIAVAAPADPALAPFASGDFGDLTALRFAARLAVPDLAPLRGEVILRHADGPAALARIPVAGGQLTMWNLPLDPRAGSLPARAEFVPLLGEVLLAGRGAGARGGALQPGQELVQPDDGAALAGEWAVAGPAGARAVARRESGGISLLVAGRAEEPGLYRWTRGGEAVGVTVVNFPSGESDLRTVDPGQAQRGWVTARGGANLRHLREGRPLWPALLAVMALAGLLESAVAWRSRGS